MPPFTLILSYFAIQAMVTAMMTAPVYAMAMATVALPGPVLTASK